MNKNKADSTWGANEETKAKWKEEHSSENDKSSEKEPEGFNPAIVENTNWHGPEGESAPETASSQSIPGTGGSTDSTQANTPVVPSVVVPPTVTPPSVS